MQSVYFYLVLVISLKNLIQSEIRFENFKQKYIFQTVRSSGPASGGVEGTNWSKVNNYS